MGGKLPKQVWVRWCRLVGAAALLAALLVVGCSRRRPAAPAPGGPVPARSGAEAARDAVTSYLQELQAGRYAAAHARLSAESRKRHPLDEFARLAKQGLPVFDLESARAKLVRRDRAEVTIHQEEDPGSATIAAVVEEGEWRVVYIRGRPGWPYPA